MIFFIEAASALQKHHISSLLMALFFTLTSWLITADLFSIYKSLLPYQRFWDELSFINQARCVILPFTVALAVWYYSGAFIYRPRKWG
jgi:uncharacterized RDD family membrane protein YckC